MSREAAERYKRAKEEAATVEDPAEYWERVQDFRDNHDFDVTAMLAAIDDD